jgi:hypothetical protein
MAKIGEILMSRRLLTTGQLERALTLQKREKVRLGVLLVKLGYIDNETLATALSEQLGVPLAPPGSLDDIPPEVIDRVPRRVAEGHRLVPIRSDGSEVHVCLADPQNLHRLDEIAFALACRIRPFLATELVIERALARYYPVGADAWDEAEAGFDKNEQSGLWKLPDMQNALPVVEAVVERPVPARRSGGLPDQLSVEPSLPSASGGEDAYEALAEVKTREDLVDSLYRYFCRVFPYLGVLEVTSLGVRCMALRSAGAAVLLPTERVAIADAQWIRAQLSSPRVRLSQEIDDPHLRGVLRQLGLRPNLLAVVPVFDYGRLRYLVLGQGRDEAGLRERYRDVRSYLATVSEALRIVALREHIRARAARRRARS